MKRPSQAAKPRSVEPFNGQSELTATLAGAIADDASTVVDTLDELIGEGANEAANVLAGLRLLVCRMGALADELHRANAGAGAPSWRGSALDWLMPSDACVQALALLSKARGGK